MATDFTTINASIDTYIDSKELTDLDAITGDLQAGMSAYAAGLEALDYSASNAVTALRAFLTALEADILANSAIPSLAATSALVPSAEKAVVRAAIITDIEEDVDTALSVQFTTS